MSTETPEPKITTEQLVAAIEAGQAIVCYSKCYSCMFGCCFDPPPVAHVG